MTDLNPGIRRIVALLNEAGFATTDSGDGETHDFECDRDYGYVSIVVDRANLASEADRVAALLTGHGVQPTNMAVAAKDTPVRPPEGHCWIQANYSPVDGVAIVDVQYVHDRMLRGGA